MASKLDQDSKRIDNLQCLSTLSVCLSVYHISLAITPRHSICWSIPTQPCANLQNSKPKKRTICISSPSILTKFAQFLLIYQFLLILQFIYLFRFLKLLYASAYFLIPTLRYSSCGPIPTQSSQTFTKRVGSVHAEGW